METKMLIVLVAFVAAVSAGGYTYPTKPSHKGWSDWGSWGDCSADCGGGMQHRTRTCQAPKYLAKLLCKGSSKESRPCNTHPCKVDGRWGEWGSWSTCSKDCKGGSQTRTRKCDSPAPANGGAPCQGSSQQTRSCNDNVPCKVDGRWGEWGSWSTCSKDCKGGSQTRTRKCDSPAPANGGAPCQGSSNQSRSCNDNIPCDVDGGWSSWSSWSSCSKTCRGGVTSRSRTCTNPAPVGNGKDCRGKSHQSKQCNKHVKCGKKHPY